jgi:hypothetical protein
VYDLSCDVNGLQQECNKDAECIGFIHSEKENTWQKMTYTSTANMYKITDTSPNIYVREATVEMNDKSCKGGSPMFIDASMFASYPKGDDFVMNGDQCVYNANSVVDEKKKEYTEINNKYNNRMDKIAKNYPQLPLKNKESTNMYKQLNSKTAEYKQVLNKIVEKKKQNNETYQQQMADMNVLENSNKTNSLVWGLSALIVIGMVVMVRNKTL